MASTNPQTTLSADLPSKFTLFPDLPKELRDMIWDLALPEPRIASIMHSRSTNHPKAWSYRRYGRTRWGYVIDITPIPTPLLHTSCEARTAAFRRYEPAFSGIIKGGPIYFDFGRDSLLFTSWLALKRFCEPGDPAERAAVRVWQAKVRNVGVEGAFFDAVDQAFFLQCPLIRKLIVENPHGNDGCEQHGIDREKFLIRNRFVDAWKARLQTDDETKLPVLDFTFFWAVKGALERS
jgi:hypothetical protein